MYTQAREVHALQSQPRMQARTRNQANEVATCQLGTIRASESLVLHLANGIDHRLNAKVHGLGQHAIGIDVGVENHLVCAEEVEHRPKVRRIYTRARRGEREAGKEEDRLMAAVYLGR